MHPDNEKFLKTITILSEHEMAIGRLYEKFSRSKPNARFWLDLAKEEFVHHQWLTALYLNAEKDKIYFDVDSIKEDAVKTSIKFISGLIHKSGDISLMVALNHALDIEKAMIENKYFSIFKTENEEVKHILADLENETKAHISRIEQELTRIDN